MFNLNPTAKVYLNLSPDDLVKKTLELNQGALADNGAIMVETGKFTGRSPKDRFIVCDEVTENTVFWGDVNIKFSVEKFDSLLDRINKYLENKEVYIRDASVCADPSYRQNLRVITEFAWQNLFVHDLFLRPTAQEIENIKEHDWTIISVPGFLADPTVDGTRQENFTILNFTKKIILVGGSAYAGEIKKAMFSALNYILPTEHAVLSMHCSANIGESGDTAIFFGLSGTGKTTLSASKDRKLIGDDEHGWAEESVFNFEGGCYAKCVNLDKEKEPQIWDSITKGAVLENTSFFPDTNIVDYNNISKTENTRAAYPITAIENAVVPSVGGIPKNIFFLTCDAYGILPPVSRLTKEQAMYYFLLGYTAKVAGTEVGIKEPQATFSACFGKAFMPLHPKVYADLLGKKLEKYSDINVWLINTGWSAGPYGVAPRISLKYTRAIIDAAFSGELNKAEYDVLPIFDLQIPKHCPLVPDEILNPRNSWSDINAYDTKARELHDLFIKNFSQYL